MRKKMGIVVLVVVAIVLLLAGSIILYYKYSYNPLKTLHLKEEKEDVKNPDRGFYVQLNSDEPERLVELKEEGIQIALLAYNLKDYRNIPLDETKLGELKTFLEMARQLDIKVVFRGAYDFVGKYTDPDSLDIVCSHIRQIAEVLNDYKGSVLCVQAGFLGPWGEWHSSVYLKKETDAVNNRNRILEELLNSLEEPMIIDVRRPRFIRDAKAAGLDAKRLGVHNDALLASEDDSGTYDDPNYDRETELKWMEGNILSGTNGGEMSMVSKYNNASNAVKEFTQMKVNYLNCKYNVDVLSKWKKQTYQGQNAFAYIQGHLGYRLSVKKISISRFLRNGRILTLKGSIRNTGFAPIGEDYKLSLVIEQGGQTIEQEINSLALSDLKHGQEGSMKLEIKLPTEFVMEDEVRIGLRIMKNSKSGGKTYDSYVRLANTSIEYADYINYFAKYVKMEKKNSAKYYQLEE